MTENHRMPQEKPKRDTLTVREVAERLGVCDDTVRRWCDAGELPSIRIGGRVLIHRERFEAKVAAAGDRAAHDVADTDGGRTPR